MLIGGDNLLTNQEAVFRRIILHTIEHIRRHQRHAKMAGTVQCSGEEPERVLIGRDNLPTNQEAVFSGTILHTTLSLIRKAD